MFFPYLRVMGRQRTDWLCLTCQMQQASGSPQQPQSQANKGPLSVSKEGKEPLTPGKDKLLADGNINDNQTEAEKKKVSSMIKRSVQSQHPKQQSQAAKEGVSKPEPTNKESDFFGFGRRSRSPSPQPALSGKVLGFGSSLFSSASNLISSAVQDGAPSTPPTSRKGSSVSQTSENTLPTVPDSCKKSEMSNKTLLSSSKVSSQDPSKEKASNVLKPPTTPDEERKMQEMKSQGEISAPLSTPILKDETTSDATKTLETTQALPKVCPLCKIEIKKEPPNYNICTECKSTVCNLCGFNPIPDKTEVRKSYC